MAAKTVFVLALLCVLQFANACPNEDGSFCCAEGECSWLVGDTLFNSSTTDRMAADMKYATGLAVVNNGNTAWMLASSALVMVMTPGLGMFYAGMAGAESSSNTLMMSMVSVAAITVHWVTVGYSFAFGPGNGFYGGGTWVALTITGALPSAVYGGAIPHYAWIAFQCMFAQITPALISGSVVGRMKFSSYIVFILCWATVVYDMVAHWVWALKLDDNGNIVPSGWLGNLGAIDFAGGTVIHITSGVAGLVCALILGKRWNSDEPLRPHNVPMCITGTSLLWFGWFGFNGGSAGAADGIASVAFLNTHIAASTSFLTWLAVEWIIEGHPTAVGASAGAVVGLVAITPACGFVTPMAAIAIGVVGACVSFTFVQLKQKVFKFDDTLDAFSCHGVGGMVGAFLTGCFATPQINPGGYGQYPLEFNPGFSFFYRGLAGGKYTDPVYWVTAPADFEGTIFEYYASIDLKPDIMTQGAFYGRGIALGYQMAGICAGILCSVIGTASILLILKYTIGIRVSNEKEKEGLDASIHGAESYGGPATNIGFQVSKVETIKFKPAEPRP